MAQTFDLLIRNGTVVNHKGTGEADVGVREGKIATIGDLAQADAEEVIDAAGLHVLPGVIDSQVHMREPGLTHKEDLESGGRAAVLGGVTAVFEMPNVDPPTTTVSALADKVRRATNRMQCDFAFYGGASAETIEQLPELERVPGCCGIKIFMGSSTGTLLVADDEGIARVLAKITRRAAFHCEDEERLKQRFELAQPGRPETHAVWRDEKTALIATKRLIKLARQAGKQVHVLHVTTADEMKFLAQHKDIASVETTPQHLTFAAPEVYERLGTLAQMNPPIRDETQRAGVWWGLESGVVDVIGSDHAPHTREEKSGEYPATPAGMPGVQTIVPVMLNHVTQGRLSLERFVDLTSHGVHRLFGLASKGRMEVGYDADFTIVDMKAQRTISDEWIASKCGWTPFNAMAVTGWPKGTIIRGRRVMWEDEVLTAAGGQAMRFSF